MTAPSLAAEGHAPVVATQAFRISTARGAASEPFVISLDWSKPQPSINRAVIIFHGKGRDVNGYYRALQDAAERAGSAARGTFLVAPQFLDEEDIGAHRLPADVLRWRRVAWESGAPAVAPFPISSYEIVDALLTRLADQAYFGYLHARHLSGWNQRMWLVAGVAHSARKMITSTCGVSALFDTGACPDQ